MMEDKNGLTKQLQILSVVNKNESKFKRALFVVVVLITLFSTLLSLSFSYKAYNNIIISSVIQINYVNHIIPLLLKFIICKKKMRH